MPTGCATAPLRSGCAARWLDVDLPYRYSRDGQPLAQYRFVLGRVPQSSAPSVASAAHTSSTSGIVPACPKLGGLSATRSGSAR